MEQFNGHFTSIDWCVLIGYFAATLCIGLYFWKKSRSTEGFTAAGRSLPGWLVGISIFATYLSSISYLAYPGKSFAGNWNPFMFALSIPFATWIAVRWFVPYYRESGDVSAYSNLEHRFGSWARLYAGVFYLLTQLARIGVVTYLLALPMSVIFGWNIITLILITGISVTFYTFIGGIVAVIWTDAIQTVVLLLGAVVAVIVLLCTIDQPVAALCSAWTDWKFSLGNPGVTADTKGNLTFQFGGATALVIILYGFADNLKNFGIDQSYVQRYQTAKNEKEAKRSLWLGAILYIPVSAMFFLIGTLLFILYHHGANSAEDLNEVRHITAYQQLLQSGVEPEYVVDAAGKKHFTNDFQKILNERAATLSDTVIGDRIFPHFIGKYLPPGLTGLLIAAIFSAGMSTISGSLNSSATLLLRDYYQRFIRPDASEKESMLVLYCGTIIWGILGTGVALLLVKLTDSALDIWWTLVGVFGGGMLGLFLIGMCIKRAGNAAAVFGVSIGTLFIFWMTIPRLTKWLELHNAAETANVFRSLAEHCGGLSPFHDNMIPVFGTAIMLAAAFLAVCFSRRK
ncbi:sodium:solute symporter [Planctomycetales bacterium]|nr:sodium:solute symporter [Planctomycetales bacterium]GHT35768.1 sodium:solute symporter [Planctomycetales bacterium]